MSDSEPMTVWIARLKHGDVEAAEKIWESYYRRLVGLARKRLQGKPTAAADEEDVALSAFDSFFRGVEQGRFPRLNDRDDLWRLLVVLTARKACRLIRQEQAVKRGGGVVRHASALDEEGDLLVQVIGAEPTPAFAAQVAEECNLLLEDLQPDLRSVAVAKMEGFTNAEIASRLGVVDRTVERSLAVIRRLWAGKGPS